MSGDEAPGQFCSGSPQGPPRLTSCSPILRMEWSMLATSSRVSSVRLRNTSSSERSSGSRRILNVPELTTVLVVPSAGSNVRGMHMA